MPTLTSGDVARGAHVIPSIPWARFRTELLWSGIRTNLVRQSQRRVMLNAGRCRDCTPTTRGPTCVPHMPAWQLLDQTTKPLARKH
jgi:hypothetical protein